MVYLYHKNGDKIRRRIRVENHFITLKNHFSFTEENSGYIDIDFNSLNNLVETFAKLMLSDEVIIINKYMDDVTNWRVVYLINNLYVSFSESNGKYLLFVEQENLRYNEDLNEIVSEEEKERIYNYILDVFLIKDE